MKKCCSAFRCARTDCAVCARRYAGRLARQISTISTGKFFATEIRISASTLADFRGFRVEARNFIDYRRSACFWWREFTLHGWLSHDGWVRGVGSLGSLKSSEVSEAFQSRWPTNLRRIAPDDLKSEIVSLIQPGAIHPVQMSARYQTIKLAIWPSRPRARPRSLISPSMPKASILEPMPILF